MSFFANAMKRPCVTLLIPNVRAACARAAGLLVLLVGVLGLSAQVNAQTTQRGEQVEAEASAQAPASAPAQAPDATGGLRAFPDAEDRSTQFDGATQRDARVVSEAELRRFFEVSDDAQTGGQAGQLADDLTTGSINSEEAAQAAPRLPELEDPYAPIGIRNGPLTWFPAIDLAIGYDSNVDRASDAREVVTLRLTPELRVESDWRRHAWTAQLRGTTTYTNDGRDIEGEGEATTELRLDLFDQTSVRLRGGYTLTGETASDPDTVDAADGTTYENALLAGVSAERAVGLVSASLSVDVDRRLFSDTPLANGASLSNADRNRIDGDLVLRLARAEGPIYRPFVEGSVGVRLFDEERDRNGFERDSFGYGLRGGFVISDEGPISGELSAGLVGETFADNRLDDALAASVAGTLTWDVTALTSVTLDVNTTLDPTTQAGSGVGVGRTATLGVRHALRRNVELRAGAGINDTQFSGIDESTRLYTGTAGMTWRFSPVAAVRLDTTFEHEPDSAGYANRLLVEAGITLRR